MPPLSGTSHRLSPIRSGSRPEDFQFDAATKTCICPAGKHLYSSGRHHRPNGYRALIFQGAKRDCGLPLRHRCLRHPQRTVARQVVFYLGRAKDKPQNASSRMRRKIDTDEGRYQYGRRLGTVEPVFANICSAHRLRRFSLRTKRKVNTQWLLYCMVHNIGKVQRLTETKRQ